MDKLIYFLKSVFYYSLIFLVVFIISTLALTRKVNRFKDGPIFEVFEVDKEEVVISTAVDGNVKAVLVEEGEHVKVGDILVELSDDSLLDRLEVLESFSDENLSAKTEAELLKSTTADFVVRAPRDGVVKEVLIAPGSAVSSNSKAMTLYADTGADVVTFMSKDSLRGIQKSSEVEVYSPRLEQYFTLTYKGVNQAVEGSESEYKAYFSFVNEDSSSYFFDGEKLQKTQAGGDDLVSPSEFVAEIWNSLIVEQ